MTESIIGPDLIELNKKRTPGPWHVDGKEGEDFVFLETTDEEAPIQYGYDGCLATRDATFIVALVNAFPSIIAKLQRADRLAALVSDVSNKNEYGPWHPIADLMRNDLDTALAEFYDESK